MSYLHLFNPENDLALGLDILNYTPPPQAVRIRNAGIALPIWYGSDGDEFVADGINAEWLYRNCQRFGTKVMPFGGNDGLVPAPWGWSKYARNIFLRRGVGENLLPDDETLDTYRSLSHRRTAIKLATALQAELPFAIAPPAVECFSFDDVCRFVEKHPDTLLKLPWSSSGRGLLGADTATLHRQKINIEGAIRRQGSIIAEKRLHKKLDFAMLYNRHNGKSTFAGYSVFSTVDTTCTYTGNVLASDAHLHDIITRASSASQLDAITQALPDILDSLLETYEGPLGVDMLACADSDYMLAPAIEINLRMTMGHVSRRFADRFMAPGRTGMFSIVNRTDKTTDDGRIVNGKLLGGNVVLSQPGTEFCITASVKS